MKIEPLWRSGRRLVAKVESLWRPDRKAAVKIEPLWRLATRETLERPLWMMVTWAGPLWRPASWLECVDQRPAADDQSWKLATGLSSAIVAAGCCDDCSGLWGKRGL